nr:myosin heavy chain kinase C-like isoform X1 [Onthophagus taurus]
MPLNIITKSSDDDKHSADINSLIHKNGKIYSGADDGKIKMWDLNLNKIGEIEAHPTTVYCLTSSDEDLFSCSNDGLIKSWSLNDLIQKQVIHQGDNEVYRVFYSNGILYSSDEIGDIRLHQQNELKAQFSLLEPHRELIIHDGLMYTCRDLDLVISEFTGEKTFQVKSSLMGRAPLCIIDNYLCFSSRGGKDICLHKNNDDYVAVGIVQAAHEMIINALVGLKINDEVYLFSSGWDKTIKKWKISETGCSFVESCDVEAVVNCLIVDEGNLYVGCGDGSVVKVGL